MLRPDRVVRGESARHGGIGVVGRSDGCWPGCERSEPFSGGVGNRRLRRDAAPLQGVSGRVRLPCRNRGVAGRSDGMLARMRRLTVSGGVGNRKLRRDAAPLQVFRGESACHAGIEASLGAATGCWPGCERSEPFSGDVGNRRYAGALRPYRVFWGEPERHAGIEAPLGAATGCWPGCERSEPLSGDGGNRRLRRDAAPLRFGLGEA